MRYPHRVANTNIIAHAGRLLALEEAHLPVEMDRNSLATLGFHNFGGALKTPFTAHPKRDPRTGELLFFGYAATGPFTSEIAFGTIDRQGKLEQFMARFAETCQGVIAIVGKVLRRSFDTANAKSSASTKRSKTISIGRLMSS